jgi:hypothetical protein
MLNSPVKDTRDEKVQPRMQSSSREVFDPYVVVDGKSTELPRAGNGSLSSGVVLKGGAKVGLPPKIEIVPQIRCIRRFKCVETGNWSITTNNLFGAVGGICFAANASVRSHAGTMRVLKVVMYPPVGSSSSADVNDCVFLVNQLTRSHDTEKNICIPGGITVTSPIVAIPPKDTAQAMWFTSGGADTSFMNISATAGCVIDLHVEYTQNLNFLGGTITVTTASAGEVYYFALDGVSTNKLVPVGVPTTT